MVKILFITIIFINSLCATEFETNCLTCHMQEFKFKMFMKKYTIKYSSEKRIKKAIFKYLKNPEYQTSVLPFGYLRRFGIKEKTNLADKDLKDMINIYYNKYNIKSRIY